MAPQSKAHRYAQEIAANCVATRVRQLGRIVARAYDDALRPHGVSSQQFSLLVGIIAHPQPVHANELCEGFDLEKSSVSRNLQKLIERGWLSSTSQGRGAALRTTAAGRTLVVRAFPAWQAAQEAALLALGAEAPESLSRMNAKLRHAE